MSMRDPKTYIIMLLCLLCLWLWLKPAPTHDHSNATTTTTSDAPAEPTIWTCSMHPQIQQPEPGLCPLCGMDLIPLEADSGGSSGPWELTLTPAAKARAGIQTSTVQRLAVERELELVGKVEVDEKRLTTVSSRVAGRIDRMFLDYTGMPVREGDHMVAIYSPDLVTAYQELQSVLRALKSDNPSQKAASERRLTLVRDKLRLLGMPAEQIQALEKGEAEPEQITVDAPTSGIVLTKHLNEGSYIKEGTPLYTIADLSRVWVTFQAYESDLVWLRFGQEVTFTIDAYPGMTFDGRISFIDPLLNPATRTISVRVDVDNSDGRLKPQMLARGHVLSRFTADGQLLDPDLAGKWISPMHPEVVKDGPGSCDVCGMDLVPAEELGFATAAESDAPLVIPESAALLTGKDAVVYVATNEDATSFAGRRVELGPKANQMFVVKSGLEAGDRVVTHGAFKIDSELQIRANGSMMYPPAQAMAAETVDYSQLEAYATSDTFRAALTPIYNGYFQIQTALSEDRWQSDLATDLTEAVHAVDAAVLSQEAQQAWQTWHDGMHQTLGVLSLNDNLAVAREQFKPLSDHMERLFAHFGAASELELFRYHCPMAFDNQGADWLQQQQGTANPYFGSQMFRCGSETAVLQSQTSVSANEATHDHSQHQHAETDSEQDSPTHQHPKKEASATSKDELAPIYRAYFALTTALSEDQFNKADVQALQQAIEDVDFADHRNWSNWQKDTLQTLEKMAQQQQIEAARTTFETLTANMETLFSEFGAPEDLAVYRYHCPMAFGDQGADWLQNQQGTANPYYGSMMYRCGYEKAVLQEGSSKGGSDE